MEFVSSSKYLETVIKNTTDETEEIKARIPASNEAPYSLPTIFRPQKIHQNSKIRL
jgi:hypothetical protein